MSNKNLIEILLKITISLLGVYYIVAYLIIAIIRLNYPYEIEWMEGGSLIHVDRLLQGLPIYPKPSIGVCKIICVNGFYC